MEYALEALMLQNRACMTPGQSVRMFLRQISVFTFSIFLSTIPLPPQHRRAPSLCQFPAVEAIPCAIFRILSNGQQPEVSKAKVSVLRHA